MMNKRIVRNQNELNEIQIEYNGEIIIIGGDINNPIIINIYYPNATIVLSGNAVVSLFGSSQVKEMWGSSQVKEMRGSSQVNYMWGSSQVKEMRGSSQVNYMGGSSQVKEMWGSSQVKEMWGSSQINRLFSSGNINCYGYNYIFISNNIKDTSNIILNETSQIIKFDTFQTNPTIDFYLKNFKINKISENILLFYKAVHKIDNNTFHSDYDKKFIYKLNQTIENECSTNNATSCDVALHVSDLFFAIKFGRNWSDLAILEVEVDINSIIVSADCDGKVRTNKLRVIRELNAEEYQQYL